MPPLAIVRLVGATVMQQLQIEEALLRSTKRSWFVVGWHPRVSAAAAADDDGPAPPPSSLPPLAAKPAPLSSSSPPSHPPPLSDPHTDPDPPTIVLGISGKPRELIDLPLCFDEAKTGRRPPAAIRRFSGGGTVVVGPGTVLTSLVLSREDLQRRGVDPFPHPLMRWTAGVYARAFEGKGEVGEEDGGGGGEGAAAAATRASGEKKTSGLVLNENDYCFGDLKIAGNAQAITGGRALHHTSFLWDWRDEHMRLLLPPQRQPAYRRRRAHGAFLARIRRALPLAFPRPEDLALALEEAVAEEWRAPAPGGGQGVEEADAGEVREAVLRGRHLRANRWVDLRRELDEQEQQQRAASGGGG